jgi:predicted DNA-binding transcriptional regulator AlpA
MKKTQKQAEPGADGAKQKAGEGGTHCNAKQNAALQVEQYDKQPGTPDNEQSVDPPQSDARVTIDTETVARLALLAREELLTLSEVERILKTKRTSVWRMRNREKNPLPSIVIDGVPRVKRGELQDWINSHKKQ